MPEKQGELEIKLHPAFGKCSYYSILMIDSWQARHN